VTARVAGLLDFNARHLRDADGRPVAELASPLYADTPTSLVACPYADARHGQPMNADALNQLRRVWPDVLATARALAGSAPTTHQAWRVCVAGLAAPCLLGDPVPVAVSAWFKTSLGFSQVLTALLLSADGVADAPLAALGSADSFFKPLDDQRWLIGTTQVCAGPQGHIAALFGALSGAPGPSAISPALHALAPHADWIDAAVTEVALSVAHLARVAACVRSGDRHLPPRESAWLRGDVPPWLRAVHAVPNRPEADALRLFPRGAAPDALHRFLRTPTATAAESAALVDRLLG